MLLLEEAAQRDVRPDIQLFATDLDARALATAREGAIPPRSRPTSARTACAAISCATATTPRPPRGARPRRCSRSTACCAIRRSRASTSITCRNLHDLPRSRRCSSRCARCLHYALLPHGYLFLGASETADSRAGSVHASSTGMRASTSRSSGRATGCRSLPQVPRASAFRRWSQHPSADPLRPIARARFPPPSAGGHRARPACWSTRRKRSPTCRKRLAAFCCIPPGR